MSEVTPQGLRFGFEGYIVHQRKMVRKKQTAHDLAIFPWKSTVRKQLQQEDKKKKQNTSTKSNRTKCILCYRARKAKLKTFKNFSTCRSYMHQVPSAEQNMSSEQYQQEAEEDHSVHASPCKTTYIYHTYIYTYIHIYIHIYHIYIYIYIYMYIYIYKRVP